MLQQPMAADDHAHLSFALAKACEDIGKESHAFDLLTHGNRLKRSIVGYSVERDRKLFDKVRSCFANPPFPQAETTGDGPTPIFIVGMPRSGTSLVEQIVASHSKVFGCGERDFMKAAVAPLIDSEAPVYDQDWAQKIRRSYLDDLARLSIAEPFAADKLPINFRWIGFIATAFPEAKIVHMKRNPVAT
ncbi:MAG: sulfotransferase, partial [Phycisphaerales bacterium]|nr:sulfotransferase [Phycisphaerales bacterium]